jgi:hypothetical protein
MKSKFKNAAQICAFVCGLTFVSFAADQASPVYSVSSAGGSSLIGLKYQGLVTATIMGDATGNTLNYTTPLICHRFKFNDAALLDIGNGTSTGLIQAYAPIISKNYLWVQGQTILSYNVTIDGPMAITNYVNIPNNKADANPIVNVTYTGTDMRDKVAVKGKAVPSPYFGIGGQFEGGYMGVQASSTIAGAGSRYAGYFTASNGASQNIGVYSYASGTASYAGYFNGNVYISGTLTNPSDGKFKKNIQKIDNAIDKVMKLDPVAYNYDVDKFPKMGFTSDKKNGFVAQDLANVLPELVKEDIIANTDYDKQNIGNKTPDKFHSVDYIGLIPILTKAIQEQQQTIQKLEKEVKILKDRM